MKSRFLVIVLLALIAVQFVAAASFQISTTPLKNSILPNESAEFKLSITNFDKRAYQFQVYTLDTNWVIRSEPVVSMVQPQQQQEYTIWVKPIARMAYGSQGLALIVKNLDLKTLNPQSLIVHIQDPNKLPGVYAPSVQVTATYLDEVDPRRPFTLSLGLRNRNALDLSTIGVVIESPLFQKEYEAPLGPLDELNEDLYFTLDPHQQAGAYPLTITLYKEGKTVNQVQKQIIIKSLRDFRETPVDDGAFFRSTTTLTVENAGNTVEAYDAKLPTNWFRSLFSSTTPRTSTKKISGERYHVWTLDLKPGDTTTLNRVENYRLLVLALLLFLAALVAYFIFRSPIITVKEAISLKDPSGEEGTSKLKVRIFIKNRSGRQLAGVTVIDRIPSIATYVAQQSLGSVTPTKVVTTEKKGTLVKWELDVLEPYEERILTYNLGSRLRILGRMNLPSAKVSFITKDGKERTTYTKNLVYSE